MGENLHPQPRSPRDDRLPDPTQSDDSECPSHHPRVLNPLPATGSDTLVEIREAARDSHQQCNGVFGHGMMVHAGSRGDDDTPLITCPQINGVESDTRPGDHAQIGESIDDVPRVRFRAGDDGAATFEFFDQYLRVPKVDIAPSRQDFEAVLLKNRKVCSFVGVQGTTFYAVLRQPTLPLWQCVHVQPTIFGSDHTGSDRYRWSRPPVCGNRIETQTFY